MNGNSALRQRYEQVLHRLRQACESAGRASDSVQLLAVSKSQPASRVLELAALGQRAFGESYLQEALDKIATCRDERSGASPARPGREDPLEWHFIGPIQSNKTRPIAEHFDWAHSVEREKVAHRLSEQRPPALGALNLCLQVNVSGESSKSGASPELAPALALLTAALPRLRLRGLMAIPEPTDDAVLQRERFGALRTLHAHIRAMLPGEAARHFDTLSMGMSADLEAAVSQGATIVRIGSALFGERPTRARA